MKANISRFIAVAAFAAVALQLVVGCARPAPKDEQRGASAPAADAPTTTEAAAPQREPAGASTAATGDKVPLKLELPRPLFAGTPRPIQVPNLEPPLTGERPDFMVPPGTVLLSKNKPVTSSDSLPIIGELSYVTDGDKTGADGTYVELAPDLQWVQIDLGAPANLAAIVVWHFHSQARVYHDVAVQVSDDPKFSEKVRTVFNNDHDNSAGLGQGKDKAYIETYHGRIIDGKGETARYVRLYSNGNTSDELNHYVEVEVFGTPVK